MAADEVVRILVGQTLNGGIFLAVKYLIRSGDLFCVIE